MPTYEARIELPPFSDPLETEKFIDALREQGSAQIIVEIDARSSAHAAEMLAESTVNYSDYDKFSKLWWKTRLTAVRRRQPTRDSF